MKKIFISQPMNNKTNEEILNERLEIIKYCESVYGGNCQIINSFFDEDNPISLITEDYNALGYLGMSLILLSKADVAFFAEAWQTARGCCIEHECCKKYGIEILRD
jgi:hypothetical protein